MKNALSVLLISLCLGATACSTQKQAAVDSATQATIQAASTTVQKAENVASKIDNLLDLYDQYIGKYITLYRNIRSGNVLNQAVAAAEAAQLLQNANNVGDQLSGLQNQMNNKQVTRWTTLASQLGQAMKDFKDSSK